MDSYLGDSNAIISVGGGEVMNEILPYINFNKLKKAPHKFFMGFSDIFLVMILGSRGRGGVLQNDSE